MAITEWKPIEYIKTQEDLDNYIEAYIESYKHDLDLALGVLKRIVDQIPQSGQARLMRKWSKEAYEKIVGPQKED